MHHSLAYSEQFTRAEVVCVGRHHAQPSSHDLDARVPVSSVRIHTGAGAEGRQRNAQIPFLDQGNGIAVPTLPLRFSLELRELGGQVEEQQRTRQPLSWALITPGGRAGVGSWLLLTTIHKCPL